MGRSRHPGGLEEGLAVSRAVGSSLWWRAWGSHHVYGRGCAGWGPYPILWRCHQALQCWENVGRLFRCFGVLWRQVGADCGYQLLVVIIMLYFLIVCEACGLLWEAYEAKVRCPFTLGPPSSGILLAGFPAQRKATLYLRRVVRFFLASSCRLGEMPR